MNSPVTPPDKLCAACGRVITWRKKWERDWAQVKFCSERCRRKRVGTSEETAILELLATRAGGASICPSEVARQLSPDGWRELMEPVREAARRLVAKGELVITQGGRVVDPSTAKGPIRLARARR
ncbi:MAG: DUF2256 and DUF3253 domain-containing protein [Myxococcaceae bacterium]|nr:DUF2256 and DUF3253 domain-containing protein [Myxococcaceae bacterium]